MLEVLKGDAVSARTVQAAMLNAKPKMKQTKDNGNRNNWHWEQSDKISIVMLTKKPD